MSEADERRHQHGTRTDSCTYPGQRHGAVTQSHRAGDTDKEPETEKHTAGDSDAGDNANKEEEEEVKEQMESQTLEDNEVVGCNTDENKTTYVPLNSETATLATETPNKNMEVTTIILNPSKPKVP